jgi:hypothetical protein
MQPLQEGGPYTGHLLELHGQPDWVKAKREWKQQGDKPAPAYNFTNFKAQDVWMVASKVHNKSNTIYFDTTCYNHTSSDRSSLERPLAAFQ